ncbi:MAG: hypothetical protein KKD44_28755 [Proteobacteria bacterium]|nr:hypothetical protein [Pseudomonadota bacterium]
MMQNHDPINLVPIKSITTHIKAPRKLRKIKTHEWSKPRKGKITCKRCGLTIDEKDKLFHISCDYKNNNPFIVVRSKWIGFWNQPMIRKTKKMRKKHKEKPIIWEGSTEIWVILRPEYLEMLDLVGRIGIPKTAEKLGFNPSTIHGRFYRMRDRLEQGQIEINQIKGLMKKYPLVRKLLLPKTLNPTERDLEPELYEAEEA